MKQVINNSNGYVKPFELVAVMGPSGCGKTSLLNIFANRMTSSNGCIQEGSVKANGHKLQRDNFSKLGAFVE